MEYFSESVLPISPNLGFFIFFPVDYVSHTVINGILNQYSLESVHKLHENQIALTSQASAFSAVLRVLNAEQGMIGGCS